MTNRTAVPMAGRPTRLHALVGATVLASLVALALAAEQAAGVRLTPLQLVALVIGLPLSELGLLHIRFRGGNFAFTCGEACLLTGFVLASPAWFTVLAAPLVTGVHLVARRGVLKAVFNGATFTLAAAAADLVVSYGTRSPLDVRSLSGTTALVVAGLAFSTISAVLTGLVIGEATGKNLVQVLREGAKPSLLVSLGNITCAMGLLELAVHSRTALWLMPPVMITFLVGYRAYLLTGEDRDAWQQLEAAGRELNMLDEEEVAKAALARAGQMFRTEDVILALQGGNGRVDRVYSLAPDGELLSAVEHTVPVLPYTELDIERRSVPATMCVVTPLTGPTGLLGNLRLAFDKPVRLSRRERRVLSTYAHAVSTSLLNACLYADARAEAAKQAYDASHDHLTGLANRALLNSVIKQAMDAAQGTTALLLLDLDHFKEINDTLGHAAGDLVLIEVAARLRRAVRGSDLVARLGGDEFAVLLTGLSDPEQAEPVATQLLAALNQPVEYEGLHLSVDGSIGIACHPQDANASEELFRRCDVAMYQAKADRGAWLRYDPLRDDTSVQRLALVGELRAALDDQIVVYFQPQVDLGTSTIIGAEALVRWEHPERGLLQPAEFIGVAEQSGLVRPFTLRVLEKAIQECVRWQRPGRSLSVAVNLGARSLLDRQLPEDIAGLLARHGLPPQCLVLEITETTAASELEVVEVVLGQLRRLGVEISVDDFGTGYSSLAFLQRTAVHELKVDRSFVSGMLVNDNDLALVRATVHLAHSLGARAVAEGVESQALQVALHSLGCDVAQGYHLGRPMAAEALRTLLSGQLAGVPLPRAEGDRHLIVLPGNTG
ncbi:MAG: bifunctional diguanylate cyclase/phosphodiesterase [Frankiales bacterium]|nr:bifunctional diguanylate cyclase/phosphodiesterase [Frankiales bacterium]